VQEVAMPDQVVVFCGGRVMRWPHLMFFTQFFIAQGYWHVGLRNLESGFHKTGTPLGIEPIHDLVALVDCKNEGPAKKGTELFVCPSYLNLGTPASVLMHTCYTLSIR
jgi:hypothetical protein